MKKKLRVIGHNWEFDGSTITVRIPMVWKRRGGRKVIIAPGRSAMPGRRRSHGPTNGDPRTGAGASVEAADRG